MADGADGEEEGSDGDGGDFIEREVGQGEAAEARRLAREIGAVAREGEDGRGGAGGLGVDLSELEGKTEAEVGEYFRARYRGEARAREDDSDDPDDLDEAERRGKLLEVPQQAKQPTATDPKLWRVKCKVGQEREAVASILQKAYVMEAESSAPCPPPHPGQGCVPRGPPRGDGGRGGGDADASKIWMPGRA